MSLTTGSLNYMHESSPSIYFSLIVIRSLNQPVLSNEG